MGWGGQILIYICFWLYAGSLKYINWDVLNGPVIVKKFLYFKHQTKTKKYYAPMLGFAFGFLSLREKWLIHEMRIE